MNEIVRPPTGTRIEISSHPSRGIGKVYLQDMPETEWTEDLTMLYSEIHIIRMPLAEQPLNTVGALTAERDDEDVSSRAPAWKQ